jgi:hypothetical protein
MSMICQQLRRRLQLSLLVICLSGCRDNVMFDQQVWSESTAAPSNLEFWVGSGEIIKLPIHKDQFTKIVLSLGGNFYITGQGDARLLSAPPPYRNSPCKMTSSAIVLDFISNRARQTPRYVAYIDQSDMVQCVDKQFSYSG